MIRFRTPQGGHLDLAVFDIQGRTVQRLWGGPIAPGETVLGWPAQEERGRGVSAGLYFIRARLETANRPATTMTRKLLVIP